MVNVSFTIENEKKSKIIFLDVQIACEEKAFTTSVYLKPTFSGVYRHFDSFLSSPSKFGTVYKLS